MRANEKAPVIIKKKKIVGGDGHHGGAWKVAYADFVTAMMAFFLLMWLLNATTESQRKGIADYFSPTIPLSRISGGGEGSFGGDSVFSEESLAQNGTGGSQSSPSEQRKARGNSGVNLTLSQDAANADTDVETMEMLRQALIGKGGESLVTEMAMRHVITRVTDEGLVVEIFDLPDEPLFDPQTDRPTRSLELLIDLFASVFQLVTNDMAISAHVRAQPPVIVENPSWELSTQRADITRRLLEGRGLEGGRIKRITGHADREPAARNPMALRNNRIELILLRSDV